MCSSASGRQSWAEKDMRRCGPVVDAGIENRIELPEVPPEHDLEELFQKDALRARPQYQGSAYSKAK